MTRSLSRPVRLGIRLSAAFLLLIPIVFGLVHWVRYGRYFVVDYGMTFFVAKTLFELTILSLAYAVLLRDAFNLVVWLVQRLRKARSRVSDWARSGKVTVGVVVFASVFLLGGVYNGLQAPRVTHTRVVLEDLPRAFEGLKIAQLSDIHLYNGLGLREMQDIVERVNRETPDLIAITGDIADGALKLRKDALVALKSLKAPLGVWGCEGNHEHYRDYEAYGAFYRSLGMHWLKNEHGVIERAGEKLVIAGLADLQAEAMQRELPNSRKALAGTAGLPAIVLFHQPSLARKLARNRDVLLMLSGHTHAGQVLGISLLARLRSRGFLAGLYDVSRGKTGIAPMRLYVHSGTYLYPGFPLRWGTHGEIAILTLSRHR